MKCWKCGQELAEGSGICVYCGAAQSRPAPMTEVGRALRMLYDRYGAQEVLTNGAYLVNGLGDLAEDSKKLRNQLKMGLDAGLGRVYLEQLAAGTPDSAFDSQVKLLLTEDAGLNDKAAGEIAGYFDEMIGWRTAAGAQGTPNIPPQRSGRKVPGSDEVDRSGKYAKPEPEIDRSKRSTTTSRTVSPEPLPSAPVPASAEPGCLVILIAFIATAFLAVNVLPYIGIVTAVLFFWGIGRIRKTQQVAKLSVTRSGTEVVCTWTETKTPPVEKWYLAANGTWVAAGVKSPVRLTDIPQGSQITLAYADRKEILFAGSAKI